MAPPEILEMVPSAPNVAEATQSQKVLAANSFESQILVPYNLALMTYLRSGLCAGPKPDPD